MRAANVPAPIRRLDGLARTPLFCQGKTGLPVLDRPGCRDPTQRGARCRMGQSEAFGRRPAFVEAIEKARGESIAGAIGTDDLFFRHAQRRLARQGAVAAQ